MNLKILIILIELMCIHIYIYIQVQQNVMFFASCISLVDDLQFLVNVLYFF